MTPSAFPLPVALSLHSEIPRALAMMSAAQSAIDDLKKQIVALSLADLFERHPELNAFSYDLHGEFLDGGWVATGGADVLINEETGAFEPTSLLDPLRHAALAWLEAADERFKLDRDGACFERPAEGEDLVEALMLDCLGPEAFARWQAGCLQALAAPARAGAPPAL